MNRKKTPPNDAQNQTSSPLADTLRSATVQFEEKVSELSLLRRVGDIARYVFDLKGFSEKLLSIILEETRAENCSFMVADPETNKLVVKAAQGRNKEHTFFDDLSASPITFSFGQGVCGKAASEQKTILINDVRIDSDYEKQKNRVPIGSIISTPLIDRGRLLGVINISHSKPDSFVHNNRRTMELLGDFLSCLVSNAIDYVRLRDQEKFRAMSEGIRLAVMLVDTATHTIIDCNTYTAEWLDCPREDISGRKNFAGLLDPKHRAAAGQMLNDIRENGTCTTRELDFVMSDGSRHTCEMSGNLIRYQERDVLHLTARDITDTKKALDEVQKTRDFLDNVINSSLECIIINNPDGTIRRVNDAFLDLLGYARDEVLEKHMSEFSLMSPGTYATTTGSQVLITENHRQDACKAMERLFRDGKIGNWETCLVRKDGRLVPVDQNIVLLYEQAQEVTGALSVIRDISQRRLAEEELKRSEERYRGLIENANDAIISANLDGEIIDWNKKAEELFGYTRDEILGRNPSVLVPEEDRHKQLDTMEIMRNDRDLSRFGITVSGTARRKDGSVFHSETSYFALELHGEFYLTALVRDISERKDMEHRLLQSEKLRSLGELAGGVAHDFNNILAAILGRTQLLKRFINPLPSSDNVESTFSTLQGGLDIIEKAALDGAETVRRIQEFSRREDDAEYFFSVDIHQIIDDSIEFTKTKWKDDAEAKQIEITINRDYADVPAIAGNPSELRELFTNLINNAVDP